MTNKTKIISATIMMLLPLWYLVGTEFFLNLACCLLVVVGTMWLFFILCELGEG